MDVFDDYALGSPIKEHIYKEYPDAKLAQLKSGGNFPYLSRSDEVNLHLQVNIAYTYRWSQYGQLMVMIFHDRSHVVHNARQWVRYENNYPKDGTWACVM